MTTNNTNPLYKNPFFSPLRQATDWQQLLAKPDLHWKTGANLAVIELFALFHDSQRHNEHTDPDHGKRGALHAVRYREMGAFKAIPGTVYLSINK